jgi:RND family efflux transporter MFP subunit
MVFRMDRPRTKSEAREIKHIVTIAVVVFALVCGGVTLANIDFRTHRVDRDKVSIETVRRGTMEIKVMGNGQLVSKSVEELAAQVPGRVAKADIKPGALVQVGQVLVELTNPQLIDSANEARSAWEGAVAELQTSEAELQTAVMNQEIVVTQAQYNMEKAQLKAGTDAILVRDHIVPELDMKRSQLDALQQTKIYEIEKERLQKFRDSIQVQLAVKKARAAQLARALDRAKTQAADLKVVAGINGIVQAISVEVGQQLQPGNPIGHIARLDQLYAELKVPARDAAQVQVGQNVVVDTHNGTVNGVVTRVDPGVTEGTVIVDADLQGPLPAGARPQMQVEGTIYISRLPDTLFVGKPAYVKDNAEITVYKLDSAAGRYATRVTIKAGKVSLNYMQVLQGLQAGDRIITSETAGYQDQGRILLQ